MGKGAQGPAQHDQAAGDGPAGPGADPAAGPGTDPAELRPNLLRRRVEPFTERSYAEL